MRVAFLGPAGTFTEEALRASAGRPVEEAPYPSVYEAVMAVQTGAAERAVVPIENSLEGSVNATLDALAGEAGDVGILGEVVHPIRQCLLAARPLEPGQVRRVLSHPQALAQCARFLREHMPRAELSSVASTADAVRTVAESAEPWAALGSRLSGELYGCRRLAEGVEDRPDNLTRFVWLGPRGAEGDPPAPARPGAPSKTSLVFWGMGRDHPGALVEVLRVFADRQINLSKIESRPRRVRLGEYMFFADLDGGAGEGRVGEALEALGRRVDTVRVLGSYPAG